MDLQGTLLSFLSDRNDPFFDPNRCLLWLSLWFGGVGFQGGLAALLPVRYPSLQTAFAMGADLGYVDQLQFLLYDGEDPSEPFFFDCFSHSYGHFPSLGKTAICVYTLPTLFDKMKAILCYDTLGGLTL